MSIAEKPLAAWTCRHRNQDTGLKRHAGALKIQRLSRPSEDLEICPTQSPTKVSVALTQGGVGEPWRSAEDLLCGLEAALLSGGAGEARGTQDR